MEALITFIVQTRAKYWYLYMNKKCDQAIKYNPFMKLYISYETMDTIGTWIINGLMWLVSVHIGGKNLNIIMILRSINF